MFSETQSKIPPVPWTPRDIWLGITSVIVLVAVLLAVRLMLPVDELEINAGLLVSLGELMLLIPIWGLALHKYRVGWRSLGLRGFAPNALAIGCGLMLLSFAFNLIYSLFLAFFGQRMQADFVAIFESLSSPWLMLLGGVIIAPIIEELFFRGFVFAGLKSQYGWQKAALISAALFSVVHLTPNAIIPIFFLGLILAYLYHLSGSIWPAILMHMLTNGLALGAAYYVSTLG